MKRLVQMAAVFVTTASALVVTSSTARAQSAPSYSSPPSSYPSTSPSPTYGAPSPGYGYGTSYAPSSPRLMTQREARTIEQSRPNVGLISSGLFTLGVPYATSIVVAAQSDRPEDQKLYVPVAGPWLNLANRSDCGTGRNMPSCDNENTYKVLLVADGVLQGLGALEILGGLIFPETRTVAVAGHRAPEASSSSPTIHFSPARVGQTGYGLSAAGTF